MFNNFPYTNFHDLNLDWIVKTVKLLFNKAVFSINNVEPDAEGNVTITGAELGAVGTINNIAPVDGNVTLTASDVGAVAQGVGVTKVNGFGPDSSGNVLSGTVRSINGISPASLPTPGNVVLNASDVGALPSTIDPVETVNGISPDANGNVNVGTVKSVNGSAPDAQGNVNLPTVAGVTSVNGVGPDAQGNVQIPVGAVDSVNNVTPVNGDVTLTASDVGAVEKRSEQQTSFSWDSTKVDTTYSGQQMNIMVQNGTCFIEARFKLLTNIGGADEVATGLPTRAPGAGAYLTAVTTTSPFKFAGMQGGAGNNNALRMYYIGGFDAGEIVFVTGSYPVAQ